MARQPFLPVHQGKQALIGMGIVGRNPGLAAVIGLCAANWSSVEMEFALTLGSLLGVESPGAVAVFLSLRNHRAQRDALEAAAAQTLTGDLRELFEAILNVQKTLDGQRNGIVHCVWGYSPQIPDAALWCSTQDYASNHIKAYHREATKTPAEYDEVVANQLNGVFVYPFRDIEELAEKIFNLGRAVQHFHVHLRYGQTAAGAAALHQLYDEPLIRAELERMRSSGKSSHSAPRE